MAAREGLALIHICKVYNVYTVMAAREGLTLIHICKVFKSF